jgi:predicted Zn-dependent protease
MKVSFAATLTLGITTLVAGTASAQFGSIGKTISDAQKAVDKGKETLDSLTISDQEEQQIGSDISAGLRNQYGVVQDQAVHKYVTLVGSVLAKESTRPNLRWTFVVLDTDGVNAFAAPGGYVHVTRGALALMQNEAELADVLAHEINHVTEKHTINAIRKSNQVATVSKAGEKLAKSDVLAEVTEAAYRMTLENKYDRVDEMAADRLGMTLANKVGYAPTGLGAFLTRLADRNKSLKDRSGMFASHPETKDRISAMSKIIASAKLTASATVVPRYAGAITYKPVPIASVPQGEPAAASRVSGSSGGGGGKLGLGNMTALGNDKNSSVSSGGSRGVNPDRDAKGGPVKTLVAVSVSAAEIATFRTGIV